MFDSKDKTHYYLFFKENADSYDMRLNKTFKKASNFLFQIINNLILLSFFYSHNILLKYFLFHFLGFFVAFFKFIYLKL
jgi:hypothetical protein